MYTNDVFAVRSPGEENLLEFMNEASKLHPMITFTAE